MMNEPREKIDGIGVLSQNSERPLNELQLEDYRDHRRGLIKWALNLGEESRPGTGVRTVHGRSPCTKARQVLPLIWKQEDDYTLNISTSHADEFVYELAQQDHSNSSKAGCIKSLKMLFNYKSFKQQKEIEWGPPVNFSSGLETYAPRDYLTPDELKRLMESLKLGTIPNYRSVTPRERSRWKAYLAQRFEKPKNEIGLEHSVESRIQEGESGIYFVLFPKPEFESEWFENASVTPLDEIVEWAKQYEANFQPALEMLDELHGLDLDVEYRKRESL